MRDRDEISSQARGGCSSVPVLVFAAASHRSISLTAACSHANHPWNSDSDERGTMMEPAGCLLASVAARLAPRFPVTRTQAPSHGSATPSRMGELRRRLIGYPVTSCGAREGVDSFTNYSDGRPVDARIQGV